MMRSSLVERMGGVSKTAFPFMGVRCDRVVHGVFARIEKLRQSGSHTA